MSKERARRRDVREQEAATRAAAREASERRTARRRALVDPVAGPVRRARLALFTATSTGRQTGSLAHQRRTRLRLIACALVFVQVIVWIVRPDWEARFAALVIAALAFPVIAAFTL